MFLVMLPFVIQFSCIIVVLRILTLIYQLTVVKFEWEVCSFGTSINSYILYMVEGFNIQSSMSILKNNKTESGPSFV